jgi:uncharacterized membrane-anchored protein
MGLISCGLRDVIVWLLGIRLMKVVVFYMVYIWLINNIWSWLRNISRRRGRRRRGYGK